MSLENRNVREKRAVQEVQPGRAVQQQSFESGSLNREQEFVPSCRLDGREKG